MATREVFESRWQAAALLLPTVLVSVVFLYVPAVRAFELSLFEVGFGTGEVDFVGLENYRALLTSSEYHLSVLLTVLFAVAVVVGVMSFSLLVSFLVHEVEVGKGLYLVSAIWPYALPPAVAGFVFFFLLHPDLGVLTRAIEPPYPTLGLLERPFEALGVDVDITGPLEALGPDVDWFSSGPQAFALVTVVAIWKQVGYNVIFMSASMNNIPGSLTETARLDGVGRLERLLRIYVPIMSPTLAFLAIMNTIYAFFGTFAFIDVMTDGGPAGATNILIFDLYRDALQNFEFGTASAKSVVLFVVVGALMYVQFRVTEEYAYYGG